MPPELGGQKDIGYDFRVLFAAAHLSENLLCEIQ